MLIVIVSLRQCLQTCHQRLICFKLEPHQVFRWISVINVVHGAPNVIFAPLDEIPDLTVYPEIL